MVWWGPQGGWDPLRPFESLNAMFSARTVRPMPGSGSVLRALLATTRRRLVGRRFTFTTRAGEVALTLEALDADLDPIALAFGQLDDVRLTMGDLIWGQYRLVRVTATLHNVHLRPGSVPVLVAAPIELVAEASAEVVAAFVGRAVPALAVEIGEDGVGRLRWRRRPDLGHLEVDAQPEGAWLWLRAQALEVGGRRRAFGRAPSVPVARLTLPAGLRLTRLEPAPSGLRLHAALPAWREPLPARRLDDLLARVGGSATSLDNRRRGGRG